MPSARSQANLVTANAYFVEPTRGNAEQVLTFQWRCDVSNISDMIDGVPLILIVEDNEDDLFLLNRALARAGVANPLRSVRGGSELTKYLMGIGEYKDRQKHPLPGLILLDLKLRDMQGTDVLRFLNGQKDFSDITVVVWTAHVGPRDAEEIKALAIKCCVPKPPNQKTLDETVRGLNDLLATQRLPALVCYSGENAEIQAAPVAHS